jgi:hypothetical protein
MDTDAKDRRCAGREIQVIAHMYIHVQFKINIKIQDCPHVQRKIKIIIDDHEYEMEA